MQDQTVNTSENVVHGRWCCSTSRRRGLGCRGLVRIVVRLGRRASGGAAAGLREGLLPGAPGRLLHLEQRAPHAIHVLQPAPQRLHARSGVPSGQ